LSGVLGLEHRPTALTSAADGALLIAGIVGDPEASGSLQSDVFTTRVLQDEVHWTRAFGGTANDVAESIAAHAGLTLVGGYFGRTVDFDPGPQEQLRAKFGSLSAGFLSALDASGSLVFASAFSSPVEQHSAYVRSLSARADALWIAGSFRGRVSLGDFTLTASADLDGFVARLSADGTVLSARALGGDGRQTALVAGAPDGTAWVVATSSNDDAATSSASISHLANDGTLTSQGVYVTARSIDVSGIAVGSDGMVYIVGAHSGRALFADTSHDASGRDGFVLQLDRDGTLMNSLSLRGDVDEGCRFVVHDGRSRVWALCNSSSANVAIAGSNYATARRPFAVQLEPADSTRCVLPLGGHDHVITGATSLVNEVVFSTERAEARAGPLWRLIWRVY
jgi:hypothetical protein